MARPPLTLDIDCVVQCASCHFWNNLRDIGRVEPGVCIYCDELKELRSSMEEVRGFMVGNPTEWGEDLNSVYRGLCEALVLTVSAMRAGHM